MELMWGKAEAEGTSTEKWLVGSFLPPPLQLQDVHCKKNKKKKVEHFGHHEAFGDPGYDLLM